MDRGSGVFIKYGVAARGFYMFFNPRLRTSSSVGDRTASERLTTVLRVISVFCLGVVVLRGP